MEVVKDNDDVVITGKKKPIVPKIVICPDWKSLPMVQAEFIAAFGAFSVGVLLITLEEAIEHKLPIRKAQEDYANKIPHPIYLANTVDELIHDHYADHDNPSKVEDVKLHFINNPRKMLERNDACLCKSGKKFKQCCIGNWS